MNSRRNAYTEVYTILQDLNEEEYQKIPPEIIETIRVNRNEEYEYELDDDLELKEQLMLPQTKAILFNLFRDYLSTPEQQEKIIRMQKEERYRNEQKKQQEYKVDIFADKQKNLEKEVEEHLEMIEYKENVFTRIIKYIKNFINRLKNN